PSSVTKIKEAGRLVPGTRKAVAGLVVGFQMMPVGAAGVGVGGAPDLADAYARAREVRNRFVWGERIVNIAKDGSQDYDKNGLRKEHILRSKLTVETMQWHLERSAHKQWGPKTSIQASVQTSVAEMSPEQRMALVDGMMKRLKIIARPAIEARERERQLAAEAKLIDVTPPVDQGGGIGSSSGSDDQG